jgi:hypothetical protein
MKLLPWHPVAEFYKFGVMETPSPYQSPQSHMSPQPPADIPDVMMREPGAIKVFGVFHFVVAGYGIIMGLISLISTIFLQEFTRKLTSAGGPSGPSSPDQDMAMMSYMNELKPFTYVSIVFTFTLAVMLIIAGIGLIKGREKGRVMSIRYAWTSIGMKLMTFIYTIAVVIPATKRMTDAMYAGLPSGLGNTMGSFMQYSQLFTIIMTCAYPVVVLIIMKGQKIKEYLAGR